MKTPFAAIAAHAVTFLGCKDLDSMKSAVLFPKSENSVCFYKAS